MIVMESGYADVHGRKMPGSLLLARIHGQPDRHLTPQRFAKHRGLSLQVDAIHLRTE